MGSAPSPPTPPNPQMVAQQQTQSNIGTAGAQSRINNVSQYGPQGSYQYTQTGTGPNGEPIYSLTENLDPALQGLSSNVQGAAQNLSGAAAGMYSQLPQNGINGFIDQAMNMQQQYMQPWFNQQQSVTNSNLENQGLAPGDQAYDLAQKQLQETQTQSMEGALNQFLPQAYQAYELPAQTIGALEGLQPGISQFSTPQTGVSPTDVVGAYNNYQQAQEQNYQAQMQNYSSMMGGLFSIPAALAGGWARSGFATPSDRRLKRDIVRLDTLANGLGFYAFRYLWSDELQVGLMADEVERIHPEAVFDMGGGYKAVDYALAVQ